MYGLLAGSAAGARNIIAWIAFLFSQSWAEQCRASESFDIKVSDTAGGRICFSCGLWRSILGLTFGGKRETNELSQWESRKVVWYGLISRENPTRGAETCLPDETSKQCRSQAHLGVGNMRFICKKCLNGEWVIWSSLPIPNSYWALFFVLIC